MQDLLAYMDPKFSMFILFTRVSVSCHNRRVSACHAARISPSCVTGTYPAIVTGYEEGQYNFSDIDQRAIKEIERIAEEKSYTPSPSVNKLSDDEKQKAKEKVEEIALGKSYTRPSNQVVKQKIDKLARSHEDKVVIYEIYRHYEAFEKTTIPRLEQRIKSRFSDDAQKKTM